MNTIDTMSEASRFFLDKTRTTKGDEYDYFAIATIITSWVLLETYVAQVSQTLSIGRKLAEHEKAYLQEKELKVDQAGIFRDHKSFPPTSRKILFILNLFSKKSPKEVKEMRLWSDLADCEDLRNRLIHPKGDEFTELRLQKVEKFRDTVIEFIRYMQKSIFKKSINLS